jgi:hypothetical protein
MMPHGAHRPTELPCTANECATTSPSPCGPVRLPFGRPPPARAASSKAETIALPLLPALRPPAECLGLASASVGAGLGPPSACESAWLAAACCGATWRSRPSRRASGPPRPARWPAAELADTEGGAPEASRTMSRERCGAGAFGEAAGDAAAAERGDDEGCVDSTAAVFGVPGLPTVPER